MSKEDRWGKTILGNNFNTVITNMLARKLKSLSASAYKRFTRGPTANKSSSSRSRTTTVTRTKARPFGASGSAQPITTFKHGKQQKINKKFINKVRQAVSSADTYQTKNSIAIFGQYGECAYSISPVLYGTDDMSNIANLLGASNATKRFQIRDGNLHTSITNQSSGVCCMRVYECQFRYDVPYSPPYSDPLLIANRGWVDAGYPNNKIDLSSTVFSSPAFCSRFKVLNVRQIELNAGETKHIVVSNRSPTIIDMERYATGGTSYSIIGTKTARFLMFQQWGQVVNDATTTTNVSTDRTKVDFLFGRRYTYTWTSDYTNTLTSTSSVPTITTAQYINETTGAKISDDQA